MKLLNWLPRKNRSTIIKLLLILPLATWLSFLVILEYKNNQTQNNIPIASQLSDVKKISQNVHNELELPVLAPPSDADKPGENGKAYKINKNNLTETQKKLLSEGWKNNAFNQFVSDLISVRRNLPDPRDQW